MKHFGLLCTFLILIHFSTQIPKFENCPESFTKTFNSCECCNVECSSEGTDMHVSAVACPTSMCAGPQIGFHEDKTKVYPDCCGHPICKEE